MILSLLLSATFTFTATATGVEKGASIEFLLAGANSDRDYESMFILDEPVDGFCQRVESLVPRGRPVDVKANRLWPTGCRIRFDPPLERFVAIEREKGQEPLIPVYTGGSRGTNGVLHATDVMPAAVFASYSLAQSPIVFDIPLCQGEAYGRFSSACRLEKGSKVSFRMTVDETSLPRRIDLTAESGRLRELIESLRSASANGDIDACVSLSPSLSVEEAVTFARALAVVDSPRVKINGCRSLFYRAFLPLEKWRDRRERLNQPFELTIKNDGSDELLFIEEDWTVEGDDPKLTPRRISSVQAKQHPMTDTCFVYASKTQTIARVSQALKQLDGASVVNIYVFTLD